MRMDEEEKIKLYLKGYKEGQKDAWSDINSLVSKHEGWELKSRIESRIGTLYQEIESKKEELKESPEKLSLEEEPSDDVDKTVDIPWSIGESYLLIEDNPDRSIQEVVEIVEKGVPGLFILRDPPYKRLKKYDTSFQDCVYVMLSSESSDVEPINDIEVKTNSPDDLPSLSAVIGEFLKSKEKPVVLLSGIPFLTNYIEEEKILRLLHFTKEKVNNNEGCLAVSLSADAIEKTFLEKLKNEFDEVY